MKTNQIACYRNLHKKTFSIQKNNKVIAHSDLIILLDITFKISEKGRLRVLKNKTKNVHAKIIGTPLAIINNKVEISGDTILVSELLTQGIDITYNPYVCGSFFEKSSKMPLQSAAMAILYSGQHVKVIEPRYKG